MERMVRIREQMEGGHNGDQQVLWEVAAEHHTEVALSGVTKEELNADHRTKFRVLREGRLLE